MSEYNIGGIYVTIKDIPAKPYTVFPKGTLVQITDIRTIPNNFYAKQFVIFRSKTVCSIRNLITGHEQKLVDLDCIRNLSP